MAKKTDSISDRYNAIRDRYNLLRHGISGVTQCWYQIEKVLPDDMRDEARAVSSDLNSLMDALFSSEMAFFEKARGDDV